jgi:pyruvate,water dikinase
MSKPIDVLWFEQITLGDVPVVGGKNASLGEMIRELTAGGMRVPPGFATQADDYWRFLDANQLRPLIARELEDAARGSSTLAEAGAAIRKAILRSEWPSGFVEKIVRAYRELSRRCNAENADVAVRSSATAEDLPQASFAGQQETYLNVQGETALLDACKRCYASLFTDRAISYRIAQGFDHMKVALSVGVQKMVRADRGGAGVMFSIDTETGFDKVVLINAAWGLGENVVQGAVDPDEYQIFKPLMNESGVMPIIEKRLGAKSQKMIYTTSTDRPDERLQDQRICRSHRWAPVRARGGESDDRLSRGFALLLAAISRGLRAGMPRIALSARCHRDEERYRYDPLLSVGYRS